MMKKEKKFNVGDKIIFYKEPERLETMNAIILDKFIFNNFDDMAETLDKSKLGFASKTKQEIIDVYRTIYTKEDELRNGVVVFKIKVN